MQYTMYNFISILTKAPFENMGAIAIVTIFTIFFLTFKAVSNFLQLKPPLQDALTIAALNT